MPAQIKKTLLLWFKGLVMLSVFAPLWWGTSLQVTYANGGLCDPATMTTAECDRLHEEAKRISREAWDALCAGRTDGICERIGVRDIYDLCMNERSCKTAAHILKYTVEECLSKPLECTRSSLRLALKARGILSALLPTEIGHDYPDLSGRYEIVTGINPSGTTYGGIVTITKQNEIRTRYCMKWEIANSNQIENGCGHTSVDHRRNTVVLTVDWGTDFPVIYDVSSEGRFLKGTWHNGAGREDLQRR